MQPGRDGERRRRRSSQSGGSGREPGLQASRPVTLRPRDRIGLEMQHDRCCSIGRASHRTGSMEEGPVLGIMLHACTANAMPAGT